MTRLRGIYGITPDEFRALVAAQDERCAACGERFNDDLPRIDHNHETGAIRGLLHNSCNIGIGHSKDNPETLRAWADYLEA